MNLKHEEIIKLVNKEKSLITILFFASIVFGTILIYLFKNKVYVGTGVFCYLLGILCLPKINKAKQDIQDVKNDIYNTVTGEVQDLFPEKDKKNNGRWIILIKDLSGKKSHEYILDRKINVEPKMKIKLKLTKYTNIPISIEEIKNES